MINDHVYEWLKSKGFEDRLTEHSETIDTVEHAAQQIGCLEAEIAKTLSFIVDDKPVVVVMAGDGRVNSSKFKALFHTKPSMAPRDRVEELIGFAPAGGNEYTSVKLTPDELEQASDAVGWCDVCKGWEENGTV